MACYTWAAPTTLFGLVAGALTLSINPATNLIRDSKDLVVSGGTPNPA